MNSFSPTSSTTVPHAILCTTSILFWPLIFSYLCSGLALCRVTPQVKLNSANSLYIASGAIFSNSTPNFLFLYLLARVLRCHTLSKDRFCECLMYNNFKIIGTVNVNVTLPSKMPIKINISTLHSSFSDSATSEDCNCSDTNILVCVMRKSSTLLPTCINIVSWTLTNKKYKSPFDILLFCASYKTSSPRAESACILWLSTINRKPRSYVGQMYKVGVSTLYFIILNLLYSSSHLPHPNLPK